MFYSVAPPRPYLSWGFLRWLHLSSVEYFRSFQPVSGLRNWYLAVGQAFGLSKLFSLIHFISFYISKASNVFSYSRLPVKSIAVKCMKSISFFCEDSGRYLQYPPIISQTWIWSVCCAMLCLFPIKMWWFSLLPQRLASCFSGPSPARGMVNMSELRKITEVPFPFPYSQFLGRCAFLVRRVVAGLCSFALASLAADNIRFH